MYIYTFSLLIIHGVLTHLNLIYTNIISLYCNQLFQCGENDDAILQPICAPQAIPFAKLMAQV